MSVEGFDAVAEIMTNYYKELLGTHNTHRTHIDDRVITMDPYLTIVQQIQLYKPFSDQDIKRALLSIPNYKSPRPDGDNSGFFNAS